MNIRDLKYVFSVTPCDQAIMLESIHGVGKSEFIKEYWEGLGYRVVILFCSQMSDAGDVIGMPDRVDIDGVKTTIFCQPYWWPKPGEKVVIFLDELNRAKPEVIQCVQDMVLNRKLAGKTLPPETRIIAAINPFGDSYDYDTVELDPAFLDRFNLIAFLPDHDEWNDWAIKNKVNPYIIGFIAKNPGTTLDPPKNGKLGEVYPSRRSWKRLSDILNKSELISASDPECSKVSMIARSIVGIGATSKFVQYLKDNMRGINVGRILMNWDANVEDKVSKMSNQELISTNDEIAVYIEQNESTIFVSDKIADLVALNLEKYFRCVQKEIRAHFFSIINGATDKNKTWQDKLLDHNHHLYTHFVDMIRGKDEHDKLFESNVADEIEDLTGSDPEPF